MTLGLVALATGNRKARKFLAMKLLGDGSLATFNMVRQVVSFRRLCSWCTATAVCTVAMLITGRDICSWKCSWKLPVEL